MAAALAARARIERLLASPTPFSGDDGSADPFVTAALESTGTPRHEYLDNLWAALTASRVIVPVAAHALTGASNTAHVPGPVLTRAPGHEPHTQDAAQDAAALAVGLPDGHIALPVFTSAEAMRAWRQDVRPVPIEPLRAAQVAVAKTDQLWVLDPGTRDLRLPRPAVVALAGGEDWVPSWRNGPVQAEVVAQLGAVEGVTGVAFAPGEGAELRVFVRIDACGGMAGVAATLEVCQMVMVNPAWGDLIDTVELCPLPA
ncbi:SseB family protein [Actinomyces sp. W5033]|uniref:SseB family protein n=1 Tax=Actinomyces sp. W5033 TaxID=3446479 RepID=UPI003EE234F7